MTRYDITHAATRVLGLYLLAMVATRLPGVLQLLFKWDLGFWNMVSFLLQSVIALAFAFGTKGVLDVVGETQEKAPAEVPA